MANSETKSSLGTLYSTKTSKAQKHNTENYTDEQHGLPRKTGMNADVGEFWSERVVDKYLFLSIQSLWKKI
jgi:hypothetical protein